MIEIRALGKIWEPGIGTCCYTYRISTDEAQEMLLQKKNLQFDWFSFGNFLQKNITREMISEWLNKNAGDFSRIEDFSVVYKEEEILSWENPKSIDLFYEI